ncbi:MAG TPA: MarR family transcriptional regulator [Arthrobacter sp.]|jgi:DNA-binding MarR family transcriptional regulator
MPDLNNWPMPRLLSTAARLVEHAWDENLASVGITHAGFFALEVLETGGPMAQARLAAKVRVQAQTIGTTLARLEAHGHVTRVRSQSDRRSLEVKISDLGRTALTRARELDQYLIPGDETGLEELRDRMEGIIRLLGSSRWGEAMPENMRKVTNEVPVVHELGCGPLGRVAKPLWGLVAVGWCDEQSLSGI